MKNLIHGLYEIYWFGGGSSLASVGYDRQGNTWYAPCNWVSGSTTDWTHVKAYRMIVPNDYQKKLKGVKSEYPKVFMNTIVGEEI